MERIDGTYCPLCGEVGLAKAKYQNAEWAYCPVNSTGPKDAHTAYVIRTLEAKAKKEREDLNA